MSNSFHINWDELPWYNMWGGADVGFKISQMGDVTVSYSRIAPHHKGNPHKHSNAQVCVLLQGTMDFYLDGVCHHVTTDDVFFVPANAEHYAIPTCEEDIINMELFLPARTEYVEKYEAFLKSLAQEAR